MQVQKCAQCGSMMASCTRVITVVLKHRQRPVKVQDMYCQRGCDNKPAETEKETSQ